MPAVDHNHVSPGTLATAATGETTIDALAAASDDIDADNTRSEFATLDHFSATRAVIPSDSPLPVHTFVDDIKNAGTHTFGESTWTPLSPGGTDVTVSPTAGAPGTLSNGSVLRWHFTCTLFTSTIDSTASAETEDDIAFRLSIVGTDNNTSTVKSTDHSKLGGAWGQSLTNTNLSSTGLGQQELEDRRFSMSGVYIHDTDDSPWGAGQSSVHIDSVTVEVALENAGHEVLIYDCELVVIIVPKAG